MSVLLEPLDQVKTKSVSLRLDNHILLDKVSLSLNAGMINIFYGPNGAGKSLLNRLLALILHPYEGLIFWNNEIICEAGRFSHPEEKLRRKIGFVWQQPLFLSGNVYRNVEIPLVLQNIPREERQTRITEMADHYELLHLLEQNPQKLSGGQKQQVSFLRSIVHNPDFLILDEPTSSLDPPTTLWFEEKIRLLKDEGKIIALTTHDLNQAKRIGDTLNIIINRKLVETGSLTRVIESPQHPLAKAYLQGKLDLLKENA